MGLPWMMLYTPMVLGAPRASVPDMLRTRAETRLGNAAPLDSGRCGGGEPLPSSMFVGGQIRAWRVAALEGGDLACRWEYCGRRDASRSSRGRPSGARKRSWWPRSTSANSRADVCWHRWGGGWRGSGRGVPRCPQRIAPCSTVSPPRTQFVPVFFTSSLPCPSHLPASSLCCFSLRALRHPSLFPPRCPSRP